MTHQEIVEALTNIVKQEIPKHKYFDDLEEYLLVTLHRVFNEFKDDEFDD